MENYQLLLQHDQPSHSIPAFSQEGFLFNTYAHLHHQQNQGFHVLSALNVLTQQADARCAFFVRSGIALSPLAASFGSIEWSPSFPDAYLVPFIRALGQAARSAGADTLRLGNHPVCYAPESGNHLTQQLLHQGFTVTENNQTSFLAISTASFESGLVPAERRRLRKCLDAGFRFTQWQASDRAKAVDFLIETRHRKGYTPTLSPERLLDLLINFPTQCAIFSVMDGDIIAALTVAIRVRHDILYNFQPASASAYQSFSPMVLLLNGMYNYCQEQNISLLDLGLSLDENRQPKPSLASFKRNLGAKESPKLVFERTLFTL